MKAHIGVDAETGLTHSLPTTAANAQDVTQTGALHGGSARRRRGRRWSTRSLNLKRHVVYGKVR